MPPGHALHRRKPGKGQEIGRDVHADIRIIQQIGRVIGDLLPLPRQPFAKSLHAVGV